MCIAAISPFYAFQQSDFTGRLIVIILFALSVFAWTIIIEKWLALRQARAEIAQSLAFFKNCTSPFELLLHLDALKGGPRLVAQTILETMASCSRRTPEQYLADLRNRKPLPALSEPDYIRIRAVMETTVDNEVLRLESRLNILATLVSIAPFLGLFGTVWGVMMAFCAMAVVGKVDINSIAPGISGALLTTVVGLIVAMPALLGYNLLLSLTRQLSIRLDNYAAELVSWLQHSSQATPRPTERA